MKTVLCYGDSNTYGYIPIIGTRYPKDVRYPGRLQMLLGDEYTVIEEGCNGRTTIYEDQEDGWKNGLDYLKPCLNSHKPVDIMTIMLGSNDLKASFGLSAEKIAYGAGVLVDTVKEFTKLKQGFVQKIILISPPEIGEDIRESSFYQRFYEDAIERSREFGKYYKNIADAKGCIFLDAAKIVRPSKEDSLHLTAEGH